MKKTFIAASAFVLIGSLGGCAGTTPADYGGGAVGYSAWGVDNLTPFGYLARGIQETQRRQARGGIDPTIEPSTEGCSTEDKDTECEEKNKMP